MSDTGGAAFPDPRLNQKGMTLRDYFAAQAMHFIGAGLIHFKAVQDVPSDLVPEKVAEAAYEVADAMLKARQAP